ncbi:oxidoreductase mmfh [Streptomyces canarius]|uniref:Oxidoreductase mmfh n=1 Tax=Streptomyces canarius TaxID=285453 RepID=A0ABQ3CDP3_9ACTN|nr:oxidoreductase mmfh [Streptomyces canarius]
MPTDEQTSDNTPIPRATPAPGRPGDATAVQGVPQPPAPAAGPDAVRGTALSQGGLERAARVAARLAPEAHARRRLHEETLRALDEAGFARHFVPGRWGGGSGTFRELLHATAALAESCASAAWCGMLWAVHGRFAARLPLPAQRELWGAGPDTRIAAGLWPSSGRARKAPLGWLVEGRWPVVSGVHHAAWLLLVAPEDEGGPSRVFAVPREAVAVNDTWDAAGLRATGSHHVTLTETFVPEHRSLPLSALLEAREDRDGARCHTAPAQLAGQLLMCAPALGAARAALRAWTRQVRTGLEAPRHAPRRIGLARAGADIDAVELLLDAAARRADSAPVTPGTVARNQRDAAVSAQRLADAVSSLTQDVTGPPDALDDEFRRRRDDVRTVATHGALSLDAAAAAYAAGLPAGERP